MIKQLDRTIAVVIKVLLKLRKKVFDLYKSKSSAMKRRVVVVGVGVGVPSTVLSAVIQIGWPKRAEFAGPATFFPQLYPATIVELTTIVSFECYCKTMLS